MLNIFHYMDYLFLCGRVVKLFEKGANVTNSSNPVAISKNITLLIVDSCIPSSVRMVAHCLSAGSLFVVSLLNPNPVTIGACVHTITELYEDC